MKKIFVITLVLLLTLSLNACGMGRKKDNAQETEPTTSPATTAPITTNPVTEPEIIDPTMETNIPDPNVDNDHLIDPTDDSTVEDAARDITRRINGLN